MVTFHVLHLKTLNRYYRNNVEKYVAVSKLVLDIFYFMPHSSKYLALWFSILISYLTSDVSQTVLLNFKNILNLWKSILFIHKSFFFMFMFMLQYGSHVAHRKQTKITLKFHTFLDISQNTSLSCEDILIDINKFVYLFK